MSAMDLGKRLLGEPAEMGMDEVLRSLRVLHDRKYIPNQKIPSLDRLFHVRSAQQPTSVHTAQKYPIVELCSEAPSTGKTQLIYLITAVAVLPESLEGTDLGGKNSTVVIIDTEHRFDVQRLAQIMKNYILENNSLLSDTEDLIRRSLHHVHIFQPQNMASTISTLASLPTYLFDSKMHQSTHHPLHSIIVDSASAFYWQIRAEQETSHFDALNLDNPHSGSNQNPYVALVKHLQTLSQTFSCAIIATTHAFASTSKDEANMDSGVQVLRTLPAPWSTFPTTRLQVAPRTVGKFPYGSSAEEALRTRSGRQGIVEKGVRGVRVLGGSEVLSFVVTDDGVVVENE